MGSVKRLVAIGALCVSLGIAGSASAQVVSLEFTDGYVNLVVENATPRVILDEWARRGRTTIVNGERMPGGPVSLLLTRVTEQEALDVVLRGASGYLARTRATTAPGTSIFERVLVLPTSTPVRNAPAPPPAPEPLLPVGDPDPVQPVFELDGDQEQELEPALDGGRRRTLTRAPQGLTAPDVVPPVEDDTEPDELPPASTPGNPFGVFPGASAPGMSPATQPDDSAGTRRRRR